MPIVLVLGVGGVGDGSGLGAEVMTVGFADVGERAVGGGCCRGLFSSFFIHCGLHFCFGVLIGFHHPEVLPQCVGAIGQLAGVFVIGSMEVVQRLEAALERHSGGVSRVRHFGCVGVLVDISQDDRLIHSGQGWCWCALQQLLHVADTGIAVEVGEQRRVGGVGGRLLGRVGVDDHIRGDAPWCGCLVA